MAYEEIEIRRDCHAVQIPQGNTVVIPAGTAATVTQSLGGSYTLQVPSFGGLFRVAGRDADALGLAAGEGGGGEAGEAGHRCFSILGEVSNTSVGHSAP